MRLVFFSIILLLFSNLAFGQEGAIYEATYKIIRLNREDSGASAEKNAKYARYPEIFEEMKKINTLMEKLEFRLVFDNQASIFELKDFVLPDDVPEPVLMLAARPAGIHSSDAFIYTRPAKKLKLRKTEVMGDEFLVEFPYDQYHWEITNETKMIHGFKCFKATGEWERQDYTRDILLVFNPVVWFTPELPFPYGPGTYTGLPGLVIEAYPNDKICLSLTGFKKGVEVKAGKLKIPKKGKRIYYKDYDKMLGEIYPHH